jgi:hypothetical protein
MMCSMWNIHELAGDNCAGLKVLSVLKISHPESSRSCDMHKVIYFSACHVVCAATHIVLVSPSCS